MNPLHQQYLDNLTEVYRLCKPHIVEGAGREEILAAIQNAAREIRQLRTKNDQLLQQVVYSRAPESLSHEEAVELEEFAAQLFSFARGADTGLAYEIHRLLYQYAQLRNDLPLAIRELYHQGLALYYMNLCIPAISVNLFTQQVDRFFKAGADYFAQYEDIDDSLTRGYIIRCMANRRYGPAVKGVHRPTTPFSIGQAYPAYTEVFNTVMAVVHSPRYRAMDPDLPWDAFEYAMHFDRTVYLSYLRFHDDPDLARDVMESAQFVYSYQERATQLNDRLVAPRILYVYAAAQYHVGRISLEELLDQLLAQHAGADCRDFSGEGLFLNVRLPLYITAYVDLLSPEGQKVYGPKAHRCLQSLLHYLTEAPQNEFASRISLALADMVSHLTGKNLPLQEALQNQLLACHPPTYVHSRMVAFLAERFFRQMAERRPELLVGAFGADSLSAVQAQREELCQQAYRCGLFHDAGKSMMLDAVGLYGRRLLDEEFLKLQLHPQLGSYLLGQYPDMDDLAQVALRHHRYWNGQGGYPADCPPCPRRDKLVVDAVTVADAMDAATDNVGRSYAEAKSFDTLVDELRRDSGVKYAPDIVALLDDDQFRAQLKHDLHQERQTIYCEIYSDLEHFGGNVS